MKPFVAAIAFFSALFVAFALACGSDVDLGGSSEAGADASPLAPDAETCGNLVGPDVSAKCKACEPGHDDCQPNGCFGGYWCNTKTVDCAKPPTTCP